VRFLSVSVHRASFLGIFLFIAASFGLNGVSDSALNDVLLLCLKSRERHRGEGGRPRRAEAAPSGPQASRSAVFSNFISPDDPRGRDQGLVVIAGDAEQQKKDVVHEAFPFSL
jgi:hypothetical protein